MTVIELIRALRKVENKGHEVWATTPVGNIQLSLDMLKDENGEPMLITEEEE